jgi:hypothetical protein
MVAPKCECAKRVAAVAPDSGWLKEQTVGGHVQERKRIMALVALCGTIGFGAGPGLAQSKNLTLLGIPSATVAPAGVGYVALSGTRSSPMNARTDGSLELGLGLGNAETGVGVQGKVVVTSLTDDFGDSGYVGFKLSRRIAAGQVPFYAGVEVDNLAAWGESGDNDPSVSAMLTGFAAVPMGDGQMPVMFTLGAGSHLRDNGTEPGVFAGVGAGFTRYVGGSVAWSGEALSLGISLRPPGDAPVVMNLTLDDATDRLDEQRISVSVAWVFAKGGKP